MPTAGWRRVARADGSSSRSDPEEPVCTAWCHPPLHQRYGPAVLLAKRIASLVLVGQPCPA